MKYIGLPRPSYPLAAISETHISSFCVSIENLEKTSTLSCKLMRYKSIKYGTILMIVGIILLSACSTTKNHKFNFAGDWMRDMNVIDGDSSKIGAMFIDDTLYWIEDDGIYEFGGYTIKVDSIFVKDFQDNIFKYVILKSTKDSLVLLADGKIMSFHNRLLEYDKDLKFSRITIDAEWCYGDCPEFTLSIDSTGNVDFAKIVDKQRTNQKSFILKDQELNSIDSLFKSSCINKTNPKHYRSADDGWKMKISFDYDNKTTVFVSTWGNLPYRITLLIKDIFKDLSKRKLI